jgi:hypothetical protein
MRCLFIENQHQNTFVYFTSDILMSIQTYILDDKRTLTPLLLVVSVVCSLGHAFPCSITLDSATFNPEATS